MLKKTLLQDESDKNPNFWSESDKIGLFTNRIALYTAKMLLMEGKDLLQLKLKQFYIFQNMLAIEGVVNAYKEI